MSRPLTALLALLILLLTACGAPQGATQPTPTPGAAGGAALASTPAPHTEPVSTPTQETTEPTPPVASLETVQVAAPSPGIEGTAAPQGTAMAGDADGFPLTYTDAAGNEVTIEEQPDRIVSLFPSNNETLFSIGAGDQVVAVDEEFTTWPQEATDKPGVSCNITSCNVEQIVGLEPDLVLTSFGTEEILDKPLRDAGVKVVVTPYPTSLQDTYKLMTDLGRITGHSEEARRRAEDLRSAAEDVRQRAADAREVRTYFESDISTPGKPFVAGSGSIPDEIITLAGGRNVFGQGDNPFPQVSYEAIVRADPQVILLGNVEGYVGPNFLNPTTVAEVKQREGFKTTAAVKNNRVIPINADLLTPGPRLERGLREIAVALHPEIFGER